MPEWSRNFLSKLLVRLSKGHMPYLIQRAILRLWRALDSLSFALTFRLSSKQRRIGSTWLFACLFRYNRHSKQSTSQLRSSKTRQGMVLMMSSRVVSPRFSMSLKTSRVMQNIPVTLYQIAEAEAKKQTSINKSSSSKSVAGNLQ